MNKRKTLICDTNNLAFVIRFTTLDTPKSQRKKDPDATKLILYNMIDCLANVANKLQCDSIVVACESKNVWRRELYPEYKKGVSTSKDDIYRDEVFDAANMFIDFMKSHTSAYVIEAENCEADDVVGYWCSNKPEEDEAVIMSTDKDFIQLISDTVHLYSVTKKEFQESEDPEYDLFVKCIRGDRGDNIPSAYPRVRKTVLEKAYSEDYELMQLMEKTLKDGSKVGDNYSLNYQLMTLKEQPDHVKKKISESISNLTPGKFGKMSVYKKLGEIGIKSKADVLDGKERPFKNSPRLKV